MWVWLNGDKGGVDTTTTTTTTTTMTSEAEVSTCTYHTNVCACTLSCPPVDALYVQGISRVFTWWCYAMACDLCLTSNRFIFSGVYAFFCLSKQYYWIIYSSVPLNRPPSLALYIDIPLYHSVASSYYIYMLGGRPPRCGQAKVIQSTVV